MVQNARPALVSSGNIYPCRFVVQDTSEDNTGKQAGANERVIGISRESTNYPPLSDQTVSAYHAEDGDPIGLLGEGEICLLEAGDSITAGDLLKSDASGKGDPIASTGTTIQEIGAVALEDASSGEMCRVQVKIQSRRPALT